LVQTAFLAIALALVWAALAPSGGALDPTALAGGGLAVIACTAAAARAGLIGGRAGSAIAMTAIDAARAAPTTFGGAWRALRRVIAGPAPAPALVRVQVQTTDQSQAARVAAALSRGADSYTIDGDERTMLVHVLDESVVNLDALHAVADRFAGPAQGAAR